MKKFFILGCPRSGTTMLQQALNRHSHIVIPPETKFFFSFLGHSKACQLRHLRRINNDLGINLPPPPRRIASPSEARAIYEEMAGHYLRRLRRLDVTHFGEKTPEHTGHINRIRKLFPDAKILFLYRDGRDVALSLTKVPWMSSNLHVNFLVWLYYYRVLERTRRDRPENVLFVRYEDLVADPGTELRALLAFLGLPYEPLVANGYGNREGIPEREYGWKARALGKISPGYVETWRRDLSSRQVEQLERLGHRPLRSLGYQLDTDGKASLPFDFYLRLAGGALHLLSRLPWHAIANEFVGRSLCFTAG